MANIFNIYAKLTMSTTDFKARLSEAGSAATGFMRATERDLKRISGTFSGLGRDMMILGGAGALGMVASFRAIVGSAEEVIAISQRMTLSADVVKRLGFAANLAHLDLEQVAGSVNKMQKALGSGKGNGSLEALGLDPKAIKAMASDTAMGVIVERLAAVKNANDRATIAMDLFGKSGATMLQFVRNGKSELGGFIDKARELGVGMSKDKEEMFRRIGEKIRTLGAESKMAGGAIYTTLAPAVESYYDKAIKTTEAVLKFTKVHPDFVKWVTLGGGSAAFLAAGLGTTLSTLGLVANLMSRGVGVTKTFIGWIVAQGAAQKAATASTVADTAALLANTEAKTANALAGKEGGASDIIGNALGGKYRTRSFMGKNYQAYRDVARAGTLADDAAASGWGGAAASGAGAAGAASIGAIAVAVLAVPATAVAAYALTRKIMSELNLNKPIQDLFMNSGKSAQLWRNEMTGDRTKAAVEGGMIDMATGKRLVDHSAATVQRLDKLLDEFQRLGHTAGYNRAEVPIF